MRAPSKRIVSGQSKVSGFSGGRDGADGVGERRHAGEEGAARPGKRLLGLEHHGELDEVEPADMDEGAGPGFRRDPAGMSEGVAGLAQGDERCRAAAGRAAVWPSAAAMGNAGVSSGIAGATRGLGLVLSSGSSIEEG